VLVVDASIAVTLALRDERPSALAHEELVAPQLLWSESTSALHEFAFRGEIPPATAAEAIERLRRLGIAPADDPRSHPEASRIARQLGWAKTYDAEYVALASLTGARLLTLDARLARGASRLITVVTPADLQASQGSALGGPAMLTDDDPR
jgi:predicted nucleic acid-binding protein